ncbi:prolactin-releasing peptide receptor-like [Brachionus plicatilis]|uniref:Prolactin-releasing peptide receptor-like n=1 Tax=Brachionus plicatilis TaxID=10195 RepID=A0A3M7SUS5_BRAPC|nr:prolactin-releasing peptide receptor-like [Brachionus plicatilis]
MDYDMDHTNFTNRWVEFIFRQIIQQHHSHIKKRNQIIEIDYNLTDGRADLPDYLLRIVKQEIENSFSLVSSGSFFMFSFIFGLIFVFGIISNSLIIYSFYSSKNLRTFRNIFIVNLAISDILLCSICGPLTLFRYVDLNWKFGRLLCKLGPGLQTANVLVSTLSITAIAVDRWNFIVNSGRNSKKYWLYLSLFLIWTSSFLMSIPSFIVNDEKIVRIKQTKEILYKLCEETWFNYNSKYSFCTILIIVQYLLPVVVVGSTNYKICSFLHLNVPKMFRRRDRKKLSIENEKSENNRSLIADRASVLIEKIWNNQERFSRSKKILFIVFFTFCLCWLPVAVCNLLLDFSDSIFINGKKLALIIITANIIALSSTCVNPVIYGLMNKNFKQEICKMVSNNSTRNSTKIQSNQQQLRTEILRDTSISFNKNIKNANSNNTFV